MVPRLSRMVGAIDSYIVHAPNLPTWQSALKECAPVPWTDSAFLHHSAPECIHISRILHSPQNAFKLLETPQTTIIVNAFRKKCVQYAVTSYTPGSPSCQLSIPRSLIPSSGLDSVDGL
jgi:hypothetical protein